MEIGECKLCRLQKHLLKRSHIIPDFFYDQAGVYNEKHQLHQIEVQEFLKSKRTSYRFTGVYDKNILCEYCDNVLLGQLETYSSRVIYGGLDKSNQIVCKNYKNPNDGLEYSIVENVDYKKFKLFLLSILWRATISRQVVFRDITLPDKLQECLRQMMLEQNPGKFNDFPIVTLSNIRNDHIPSDIIVQPIKAINNGKITISFLISDLMFIYWVQPDFDNIDFIKDLTPSENGKFGILHIPKGMAWDVIFEYMNVKKNQSPFC